MGQKVKEKEEGSESTSEEQGAPLESAESDDFKPEEEIAFTAEDLEELRQKAAERDEFLDDLQRARADYANLQRRITRDRDTWTSQAIFDFVAELLPVLDQLELAISSAETYQDLNSLLAGIKLVQGTFLSVLGNHQVEAIVSENEPFDPSLHEALMQQDNCEVPDLTILQEIRKGYLVGGKVVRPSQVCVARNSAAQDSKDKPGTEEVEDNQAN